MQTILFAIPPSRMTVREADAIVHSLGKPSKMPGLAWGISPEKCRVGAALREIPGSTCSDCYAMKGRYTFDNVRAAHVLRAAGLDSISWRDAMLFKLGRAARRRRNRLRYFRWFDAGDLQSLGMLLDIVAIAEALPMVRFWLPTRERAIVLSYLRTFKAFPPNLVVRLSAAMIDGAPPAGFANTSTVHQNKAPRGHECPAPRQGNKCGRCRACWDPAVRNVSYARH